jgi:hypothetical protein
LLAMAYQSLGQMKSAAKHFQEAFDAPAYTEFLDYNRRAWPEFLLNRGRYEESLAASRQLSESPWAMARLVGHTLAGQALLGLNRKNEARDESNAAERESEALPLRTAAALPYPAVLRAEILSRENSTQDAERILFEVQKSILTMPGPDAWSAATFQLETMARTARDAGDWELAGFTAKNIMQHNPNYAGGYYAMALVAQHEGNAAAGAQLLASAQKLWASADADLPELALIHKHLVH